MLNRINWMTPSILAVMCIASSFMSTGLADPHKPDTPTIILIVRHAEKEAEPRDNPPLSADGRRRAEALAHVAARAGVTALYATNYLRTRQTVEPLASRLKLNPIVETADAQVLVARILREHRGDVVLIAGHSNTVPKILEALGIGLIDPIDESEYDSLFVAFVPNAGPPRVAHLQFGAPDS